MFFIKELKRFSEGKKKLEEWILKWKDFGKGRGAGLVLLSPDTL